MPDKHKIQYCVRKLQKWMLPALILALPWAEPCKGTPALPGAKHSLFGETDSLLAASLKPCSSWSSDVFSKLNPNPNLSPTQQHFPGLSIPQGDAIFAALSFL